MPAGTVNSYKMLHDQAIITIQGIIVKLLMKLLGNIDYPTIVNSGKHNTKIILGIRDYLLAHEENNRIATVIDAVLSSAAIKYDTCNHYSERMDLAVSMLLKSDWVYIEGKTPSCFWKGTDKKEDEKHKQLLAFIESKEWDKVLNLVD
jgi:hypothetical protein